MDAESNIKVAQYIYTIDALLQTMRESIEPQSFMKYSSYKYFIRKYNQLLNTIIQDKIVSLPETIDGFNFDKIPGPFDTTGIQQKELYDSLLVNLLILKNFLATRSDINRKEVISIKDHIKNCLRKVVYDTPEKEIVVQNGIESILIGYGLSKGIDYDRETGRVKVSAKETIPDFIFGRLNLALEVKLCKNKQKICSLVDEINADIRAYSKKYEKLLFVVYDIGCIQDEDEFKNDLDNQSTIFVEIVKH
ncbi:MAG: PD-(D/E)XK nuclease domain-containing protein [Planctomycetota bacterium]|jgi:hypothetical protein